MSRARLALCVVLGAGALMAAWCAITDEGPGGLGREEDASEQRLASGEENRTMVAVYVYDKSGTLVGPVDSPRVELSEEQWRERLAPEQFEVLRSQGTERPFCGTLLDNKQEGVYACAGCGLPLFSSEAKFDSGTGWPSYFRPIAKENVVESEDFSHGMVRTEIRCGRCDGHLGHVFADGPRPTGMRYCLNSASLEFTASDQLATLADPAAVAAAVSVQPVSTTVATAVLAGGCFWCTEAAFAQLDGVIDVEAGYCGGSESDASYEAVCSGRTGHAEAIRIKYDPARISYDRLLDVFFDAHDPTQLNRQDNDVGTQYRSAIFYADEDQLRTAKTKIERLTADKAYADPVVTTLEPLTEFYRAEAYHQDYALKNPFQPYVQFHSIPKMCKIRDKYADIVRPAAAQSEDRGGDSR